MRAPTLRVGRMIRTFPNCPRLKKGARRSGHPFSVETLEP